ncbi:hypothetical protein PLESTM_000072800 [Pleodorina starrii]|nr:hypothetical protein PLESTM_000072800 [Pleodorina starrii]
MITSTWRSRTRSTWSPGVYDTERAVPGLVQMPLGTHPSSAPRQHRPARFIGCAFLLSSLPPAQPAPRLRGLHAPQRPASPAGSTSLPSLWVVGSWGKETWGSEAVVQGHVSWGTLVRLGRELRLRRRGRFTAVESAELGEIRQRRAADGVCGACRAAGSPCNCGVGRLVNVVTAFIDSTASVPSPAAHHRLAAPFGPPPPSVPPLQ